MEWLGYIHTMSADWTGQELDGQHMAEIGYILDQCQRGYGLSVCSIKGVEKIFFINSPNWKFHDKISYLTTLVSM